MDASVRRAGRSRLNRSTLSRFKNLLLTDTSPIIPHTAEHIFSYQSGIAAPDVAGPCPGDVRFNFALTGGKGWGPRLTGKVKAGGGDFATLRTDGVIVLDVRRMLESHDGAPIDISYSGVIDLGPDGYVNFLNGVMPPELRAEAVPRFRAAHHAYQWLNRLQCYSIGEANLAKQGITYGVYALI